jgi:long-chain acyl-CoA synthetase
MERYALVIISSPKRCLKATSQYIALERLESVYKGCNLVSNICVHASQDATQPLAIIIPHEQHLRHAVGNISSSASIAALCQDKNVKDFILKECNSLGKRNGFKPQELLQAVILTSEEWTPENGLVTAAQKIQRAKIAKTFEKEIKVRHLVFRLLGLSDFVLSSKEIYHTH